MFDNPGNLSFIFVFLVEADVYKDPERQDENGQPAGQHEEEQSPTDNPM